MSEQFTPGRWEVRGSGSIVSVSASGSEEKIARCFGMTSPQMRADANLIASAPDLYEALEALIAAVNDEADGEHGIGGVLAIKTAQAMAALAEARGEQSVMGRAGMSRDMGVPPSGSGCQPTASAVPASRSGIPNAEERWGLTFYGSPPSVMVRSGIPGLPDSRRDIAFMEFASAGDRSVQGAALTAMVGEHNELLDAAASIAAPGVVEALRRLDGRCRRAEDEFPKLAAPDGTVAVPIGDLRLALNAAQAIEARRAATTKIDAVSDESAVGKADAPNDTPSTLTEHPGAKQ